MIPSLLPYLQRDQGNFALEISLGEPDPRKPLHGQRPFLVYSSGDPLSHLIGAAIVSDSGRIVKPLLVRVQKDFYSNLNSSLTPLTNRQIDHAWRQAHGLQTQDPDTSCYIPLAHQIDPAGHLQPLSPLFFCRLRSHYFHPPCPNCGAPLVQCYDDELLQQLQLETYTDSLRRYLYCRPCRTRGTADCFYSYERQPHDPEWVHDRRQLVHEFGLLQPEADQATQVPCPTCPNHSLCFGRDGQVENHISLLSFYPFYMMLFTIQSPPPILATAEVHSPNQDQQIYRLLGDIAAKWQSQPRDAPDLPPPISPAVSANHVSPQSAQTVILPRPPSGLPTEDPEATLILPENHQPKRSPTRAGPYHAAEQDTVVADTPLQPRSPSPQPPLSASQEEETLAETVILHRGDSSATGEPAPGGERPQTGRLQPDQDNKIAPPPTPERPADQPLEEDLPETVILRPSGDLHRPPEGSPNPSPSPWRTPGGPNRTRTPRPPSSDRPSGNSEKSHPPPSQNDDDDLLTETVILRPGKDKP